MAKSRDKYFENQTKDGGSFRLQKETDETQNHASYWRFVAFVSLIITLILIILVQPGVQNTLAGLLGLTENPEQQTPQAIDYSQLEKVKINRVVDGDTAILEDSRRIRYLNMDTPESVHPNEPLQCYGKEASELNKTLVEGREVWIKFDKQKEDRYGRLLVFVFLQGKNTNDVKQSINAYMVEAGYARSYIIKPNNTYAEEFAALELEAKEKNIGVWKDCPNPFEE